MKTKPEAAFWDTSGLALLCAQQADSARSRQLARRFKRRVVWWGTAVELESALCRLERDGAITAKGCQQARQAAEALLKASFIVECDDKLLNFAKAAPAHYGLRALDALQLAAALRWCSGKPANRIFICFDDKLKGAAEKAGFRVLP